ncbi:SCO4225 family membrane protein [Planobispora siamensis]|uniref:Uncharacterized protein n=1 Tax=Planobispora siamensis TaxID=936338 RepID=A0A8J3WMU2_9ACTN|nr:hypothetical protein [Planobispora siamensis]GIH93181.1 hypothetical protein Psi01_38110 [Planobispora siamensis]
MRFIRALTRYVTRYDRGTFALSIAGSYALIVLGTVAYVAIATHQPGSQGLEAIVLFAVTAPASQVLMLLPLDAPEFLFSLPALAAVGLLQAWLLWMIARGRRTTGFPVGVPALS